MARNDAVPDEHNLARWIKPSQAPRDEETGQLMAILPQAFELREGEDYLSVSRLEHFGGEKSAQMAAIAAAISRSMGKPRLQQNSYIAVGNSGETKAACLHHGHRVRIVEEPEDDNPAHVAIRRYPREFGELMEVLAAEIFDDLHRCGDIPFPE